MNEIRRGNYTRNIIWNAYSILQPENNCQAILKQSLIRIITLGFSISEYTFEKFIRPLYFPQSYRRRENGSSVSK